MSAASWRQYDARIDALDEAGAKRALKREARIRYAYQHEAAEQADEIAALEAEIADLRTQLAGDSIEATDPAERDEPEPEAGA